MAEAAGKRGALWPRALQDHAVQEPPRPQDATQHLARAQPLQLAHHHRKRVMTMASRKIAREPTTDLVSLAALLHSAMGGNATRDIRPKLPVTGEIAGKRVFLTHRAMGAVARLVRKRLTAAFVHPVQATELQ